jgi:hypothetical protein
MHRLGDMSVGLHLATAAFWAINHAYTATQMQRRVALCYMLRGMLCTRVKPVVCQHISFYRATAPLLWARTDWWLPVAIMHVQSQECITA